MKCGNFWKTKRKKNHTSKERQGSIAVFSAMILFSVSGTCVQLLERRIPDLELNTFRTGVPLVFYFVGILILRRWPVIERSKIAATLAYSQGVSGSGFSQFVAVSFLPAAAAYCLCCTSGIVWGIIIFALCANERVTCHKVLFAGLGVCGVTLVVQPWIHYQKGIIENDNVTIGNLYQLNKTLCIESLNHQNEDQVNALTQTNITLCEENETKSLKRPQANGRGKLGHKRGSVRLMSDIFGYTTAASIGIFLGLYVIVLKRNPYINEHPLETLFWGWNFSTTVSVVLMFIFETPVLPSNWFDFAMVIIHGVTCAVIWPFVMYGSGVITVNTITIIMSTKSVFMLVSQYTVLSSILPGHRNWMEVVGVLLVLLGSSMSSILEILADTR